MGSLDPTSKRIGIAKGDDAGHDRRALLHPSPAAQSNVTRPLNRHVASINFWELIGYVLPAKGDVRYCGQIEEAAMTA